MGWAAAVAQPGVRSQTDCRTAFADDEGGYRYVQAIEHVRLEERRHRHSPALDKHPRAAVRAQHLHHRGDLAAPAIVNADVDADDGGEAHFGLTCTNARLLADIYRRRGPVREDAVAGLEPARRIEHHAQRVGTVDQAGGQLWVVGGNRAGPDDDGIG